jgi:hypothetical protein
MFQLSIRETMQIGRVMPPDAGMIPGRETEGT